MSVAIDLASWALLLAGGALVVVGGIGVIRFPDVYSRSHAAGITDTGGAGLILLGLMLQGGVSLVSVKLALILIFFFFTTPTSTFALVHTAFISNEQPVLDNDLRDLAPDADGEQER